MSYRMKQFGMDEPVIYDNSFVAGPNPAPNLQTAERKDPYRLHSPGVDTSSHSIVAPQADPSVLHNVVPRPFVVTTVQPQPSIVPTWRMHTPIAFMARGVVQQDPTPVSPRAPILLAAPLLILSQPINNTIIVDNGRVTSRNPIKRKIAGAH